MDVGGISARLCFVCQTAVDSPRLALWHSGTGERIKLCSDTCLKIFMANNFGLAGRPKKSPKEKQIQKGDPLAPIVKIRLLPGVLAGKPIVKLSLLVF